jgi:RecJ-like exonuclease
MKCPYCDGMGSERAQVWRDGKWQDYREDGSAVFSPCEECNGTGHKEGRVE